MFPIPPTHTEPRRYGRQLPAEERSRRHRTAGRTPRGGPDEEPSTSVEVAYGQASHRFSARGLLRLPDLEALQDDRDQIVDATLRPARRIAAAMGALVSRAACAGVGAMGARVGRSSVARDPAGSWSSSFSFATEHVGMSRGLPDAVGWEALRRRVGTTRSPGRRRAADRCRHQDAA